MLSYEPYIYRIQKSETIDDQLIDYIKSSKKHYLYGNGLQTAVCMGIFRDMGLEIAGIILPQGGELKCLKGYWGRLLRNVNQYYLRELSVQEKKKRLL